MNVTWLGLLWITMTLVATCAHGYSLAYGLADRTDLAHSGRNGAARVVADAHVNLAATLMIVQILFLAAGMVGMLYPSSSASASAMTPQGLFGALTIFGAEFALMTISIATIRFRHALTRTLS